MRLVLVVIPDVIVHQSFLAGTHDKADNNSSVDSTADRYFGEPQPRSHKDQRRPGCLGVNIRYGTWVVEN
jgi:hypothetical protein